MFYSLKYKYVFIYHKKKTLVTHAMSILPKLLASLGVKFSAPLHDLILNFWRKETIFSFLLYDFWALEALEI